MRKSLFVLASLGLAAFVFLAAVLSVTAIAQTAPPQRAEILILGTYHMANPGRDIFNMSADDVLLPKRQAEIGELLFAKATGQSQIMDQLMSEIGEMVKQQDAYLHSHTVIETLLYMNDDRKVAQDVGFYYREARLGEPGDYAGPDLLASWYQRNIRIYSNIAKIIESPNERVLVIYGAGHLGWLQQDVASDPALRLRKLSEFVRPNTN